MAVAVMGKMIRLDKFLVEMDRGSRSQIKEAAKKGRILVNGKAKKKTDIKIDPDKDQVTFDGAPVAYRQFEYYMLHKPQGVVSATEDKRHKTVVDLIDGEKRYDLFPVGRLDIDTEGLLLLTNDGDLAHRLLAPKKHVDKTYLAWISGTLPADSAERMAAGMTLTDGTPVKPGKLEIIGPMENGMTEIRLTIQEGKFHQVKRMFEVLDCKVEYLKRLSMGSLKLDENLKLGEYRSLTEAELARLQGIEAEEEQSGSGVAQGQNIAAGSDAEKAYRTLQTKKAVIFDLDGTLVDSMWMWKQIDIEYLGRFGYECPETLQKVIEGMSFSETAVYFKETFSIPDSLDEIKQTWIDMSIEKYRNEVPLKKGAQEFLDYLKSHDIKAGIATSNGQDMVDVVLNSLNIKPYFQVVTTACEVAHGKPAPDIYLKVAESLGVEPKDCMVFEDVPAGIMAGKAAGMAVCAIEDAFSAEMREEKQQLADFFIEDYNEILELEED